jgi:hypothetical protein
MCPVCCVLLVLDGYKDDDASVLMPDENKNFSLVCAYVRLLERKRILYCKKE